MKSFRTIIAAAVDWNAQVDGIDWSVLADSLSKPSIAPHLLKMIVCENDDDRFYAITELLWTRSLHEDEVFPITPVVIPLLISLLAEPMFRDLTDGSSSSLRASILRFLKECALVDTPAAKEYQIARAILSGSVHYGRFLDDEVKQVRDDARWLSDFCSGVNGTERFKLAK